MSTFFIKVIGLVVKTIAKPMVSWVSYYKRMKLLEKSDSKIQNFARENLIRMGQNVNYYNTIINRKLFKISSATTHIQELNEEKALERGAEFISEVVVYSILIILPILEWMRQSKKAKEKEAIKERKIKEMRYELDHVMKESQELNKEMSDIIDLFNQISNKLNNPRLL